MTADELKALEVEVKDLQRRCARGFPTHLIDDSNSLHADCYGTLGKLLSIVVALDSEQKVVTSKITTPATIKHLS